MKCITFLVVLLVCVSKTLADGISMTKENRFTAGLTVTLKLTEDQIKSLESIRKGKEKLYVVPLKLTKQQRKKLKIKFNKNITEVFVFEGKCNTGKVIINVKI